MRSSSPNVAAILSLVSLALADQIALTSSKRGLCYVDTKDSSTDDSFWDGSNSDLTWYYNYQASPTQGITNKLNFVPMLWGAPSSSSDDSFLNTVTGLINSGTNISYVLASTSPMDARMEDLAWMPRPRRRRG